MSDNFHGSGIAIGGRTQTSDKPFSMSIGTEHGPVRATIFDNGSVRVVQGEKVTDVPYSGGI